MEASDLLFGRSLIAGASLPSCESFRAPHSLEDVFPYRSLEASWLLFTFRSVLSLELLLSACE